MVSLAGAASLDRQRRWKLVQFMGGKPFLEFAHVVDVQDKDAAGWATGDASSFWEEVGIGEWSFLGAPLAPVVLDRSLELSGRLAWSWKSTLYGDQ